MTQWTLSAGQFTALWAQTGQDRIPFPFRGASPLSDAVEFAAEQNRIRAEFDAPEHDNLAAALRVLAQPELRIEISGSLGESNDNPIRLLGGMARGHAVAAQQHAGAEVVIRRCEPYDLGRQLIAQLPDVDAGHAPGVVFPREEMTGRAELSVRARAVTELLARRSTSQGTVLVIRGGRESSHSVGGVAWRDLDADGRYLVWGDTTVAVEPGTSWDLLGAVDRLTGRIPAGHPV
ncbi:ESX secretion-associated protein EspG [Rhodococcus tibetensis]|uniref:ESX secretion-associated protein EspG n=1 Tax=Rhodococcus tibetensis TaxID=2965064 RepID=A0ABT1QIA9_9NOCA|nr:ESX secretion-associated protein EspG [Rhodococcus sp. FXJ9.536]MCQ4121998.1 ESX secretion-associated protein EspG [Rhodococcus sp. FXJ9.536]